MGLRAIHMNASGDIREVAICIHKQSGKVFLTVLQSSFDDINSESALYKC